MAVRVDVAILVAEKHEAERHMLLDLKGLTFRATVVSFYPVLFHTSLH